MPPGKLVFVHVMAHTPEAFSRVIIDAQLKDAKWNLTDNRSVRFEYALPDKTKADYVLSDRHGRALAVVEAKRTSIDPLAGQNQAKHGQTPQRFQTRHRISPSSGWFASVECGGKPDW